MSLQSLSLWPAIAGGTLIGVAATMLVLLNGRIAGIAGVLSGLLQPTTGDRLWRIAFVTGLIVAPAAYAHFGAVPAIEVDAGSGAVVLAGLLVGLGSRYASGCTSGHGICGLARLSPRSCAATLAFTGSGFATVFALRHLIGLSH